MGDTLGLPDAEARTALAERIANGDRSAEDEFVRVFQPRVLALLAVRTGDREAARDLAQEALMATIGALRDARVRETGDLAAYLHGVVRNLAARYFRSRLQRKEDPLPPDFDIAEPAVDPEQADRMRVIGEALEQLNARDRKILLMILVDGLKPGEIAARLGLKPDVVRQRKCRAVKKIMETAATWSQTGRPTAHPQ